MNVIHDNEDIIGKAVDIILEIEDEIRELAMEVDLDIGSISMFIDLINELYSHDGYVVCRYHPMGTYVVQDLYSKLGIGTFEIL